MWSSSMTAFFGDGDPGDVPGTDKLGGLVVKMLGSGNLDDGWISKNIF